MFIYLRAERYCENANVCYLIDFIQARQTTQRKQRFHYKTMSKYLPKNMQEKYKIINENNILIYF